MNRKERRVAAKSERGGPSPLSGIAALLTLAETQRQNGRPNEADAVCARVLAMQPGHTRALHMRGLLAYDQGRLADALDCYEQALAVAPTVAAIHDGLAETYRALAQPVEAERHYRRVSELRPTAVTLLNLGNALMELDRPKDAAGVYQSALYLDANLPEAYNGLGNALAALGQPQAADAFARAIALRPEFTRAHEGLIDAYLAANDRQAALQAACQALPRTISPRLRLQFLDCLANDGPAIDIPGLRGAVQRALLERWTRPQDLAQATCRIVALRTPFDAHDPLLRTLLELAPVCHREVERELTKQRRILLEAITAGDRPAPEMLGLSCVLARQCFINEYAWNCSPEEHGQVGRLRDALQADLDRGLSPPDAVLAAVAMYLPLAALSGADRLLSYPRKDEIAELVTQQIVEPFEELRLRDLIHRATSIDDDVSRLVRDQYEEHPYPRWVATAGAIERVHLADWLEGRFPRGAAVSLPADRVLDILIAGCGTGQQVVETIRSLADVKVTAIDLSLASLAYAARMTAKLDIGDIDYIQADLLQSAGLGRSFDMIGAGGVLHHLADPWRGWRALLGLLRPGGVMNVLLYTERGRRDVRCAREWISSQGHAPTAEGIRRCRHELMALHEDWASRLSASPDFFSASGCRDLLFHAHEQAVTLPEVSRFLAGEGVTLLGVETSTSTEQMFEAWDKGTSRDPLRDLARWDLFEAEHPDCFAGMLNLWVST